MGTRNNPDKFDCFFKAEPDEPQFTLLARDPVGASFVAIWSLLRDNDFQGADKLWQELINKCHTRFHQTKLGKPTDERLAAEAIEQEKIAAAMNCSLAMQTWIKANRPHRVLP